MKTYEYKRAALAYLEEMAGDGWRLVAVNEGWMYWEREVRSHSRDTQEAMADSAEDRRSAAAKGAL